MLQRSAGMTLSGLTKTHQTYVEREFA